MKSIPLFFTLFVFITSQAQNNAIKFQIGYGLPLVKSSLSTSLTAQQNGATNFSVVNGSYRSGLQLEAGYVRSLSGLVSIQFDVTYLVGKEVNSTNKYLTYTDQYSSYSRFLQFSPQLRITFGGSKLRPYASIGPTIGYGKIYKKSHYNNDGPIIDSEEVFNGSAAIGAKTSLGLEMNLGKFIFYTQLSMVNMNYAPAKSKITQYRSDGNDALGTLTVSQKQIEYKDNFIRGTQNPDQPSASFKQYYPFNSLGLHVGIMYKF
jgi:hypothetical protein